MIEAHEICGLGQFTQTSPAQGKKNRMQTQHHHPMKTAQLSFTLYTIIHYALITENSGNQERGRLMPRALVRCTMRANFLL